MSMSMMQCIPSYSRGSKTDPHSCAETRGMACDGCPLLSCIRQHSRLRPYRYWCDHVHHVIDPRIGCERRPKPPERPFFEHLRDAMAAMGVDKFALADAVGASPKTVHAWTVGKVVPRRDFMARVIDFLGMDAEAQDSGWKALGQKRV